MPKGERYIDIPCQMRSVLSCPCGWSTIALTGKAKALARMHLKICDQAKTKARGAPPADPEVFHVCSDTGERLSKATGGRRLKADPSETFLKAHG